MRRSFYRKRGGGFRIPRGRYVAVMKGMDTPDSGVMLMTGQFLIKVPRTVRTIEARFVRVYPNGKRDGTGDIDLRVTPGKPCQWTWSHPVTATGKFKVDIELRVPGRGDCEVRYVMGKVHY